LFGIRWVDLAAKKHGEGVYTRTVRLCKTNFGYFHPHSKFENGCY
jgi:hypothetical protein